MRWRSKTSAKPRAPTSSPPSTRECRSLARADRHRYRRAQRRPRARLATCPALRAADHRTTSLHLLPDGCRDALRRAPARLGRGPHAQACSTDRAGRGRPHRPPNWCSRARSCAPTARQPDMRSPSASTTPIAGSPRPRSASRSLSFPTTGSSAAFRASRANRCRLPEQSTAQSSQPPGSNPAVPEASPRHIRLCAVAPITRDRRLHHLLSHLSPNLSPSPLDRVSST